MQYHGEESSKIRENLDFSCQLSVVSRTCRTGQTCPTCPTENLLTDLDKIKNWLL